MSLIFIDSLKIYWVLKIFHAEVFSKQIITYLFF